MSDPKQRKILVVDDEAHITMLLSATLGLTGYQVVYASDGLEALQKVETERPDVIILDVRMPKMDGWEVCKRLKSSEKTREIPVIIITAYVQKEDRDKSFKMGADEFLPKPFEVPVLLELVRKVLK